MTATYMFYVWVLLDNFFSHCIWRKAGSVLKRMNFSHRHLMWAFLGQPMRDSHVCYFPLDSRDLAGYENWNTTAWGVEKWVWTEIGCLFIATCNTKVLKKLTLNHPKVYRSPQLSPERRDLRSQITTVKWSARSGDLLYGICFCAADKLWGHPESKS